MNIRETLYPSALGRIAAAARTTMMRFLEMNKRAPDYADFREGITKAVNRELLLAELAGLRAPSQLYRERREREILEELTRNE